MGKKKGTAKCKMEAGSGYIAWLDDRGRLNVVYTAHIVSIESGHGSLMAQFEETCTVETIRRDHFLPMPAQEVHKMVEQARLKQIELERY